MVKCLRGGEGRGGNHVMDKHPIQRGVEFLLIAVCHRSADKHQAVWLPVLNADVRSTYLAAFILT